MNKLLSDGRKTLSGLAKLAFVAAALTLFCNTSIASNWVGGDGGWSDIAGALGWDTASPPDGAGAIASKIDSTAAVTTQNSGFARTLGTISLGGVGDIAWTVNAQDGITLDQNGATAGSATISNTNTSTGPANALILSGPITLGDDLLVTNSGGSKNTTGAIQLNGPIGGFGNVTFRNDVTSTTAGAMEGFIRLTTTGVNTFLGNVLIQKGITWISHNNSLGDGSNQVTLGDSSGGGQGSASLLIQTQAVNGFSNPISVTAGSGGPLYLGTTTTSAPTISSAITLNASTNLNVVGAATTNDNGLTMSGLITGAGSITMPPAAPTGTANGRIRFSGFSDYTGGTTVSGGTLLLANGTDTDDPNTYTSGPVGRGTVTLNGGTLAVPVSLVGEIKVANPINVAAASTVMTVGSAGDTLTLTGPVSISPNTQLNLVAGNTSTITNLTGPITGGSTAVINFSLGTTTGNGANNILGDLSGFTGTFKILTGSTAAASLGTNANLTYHTVNGQNIKFEINAAGGNTNIPVQQSRFFRFGFNNDPNGMPAASLLRMGSLSGSGHINAQTGGTVSYVSTNYEVGHLNLDTEFSGQIFPRGVTSTFTKVGTGSLTLSGPNSYNGTTVVSAGTLIAGARVSSSTVAATAAAMPAGDTITMAGHNLSVGDRLLSSAAGAGSLTTTTNYVVHTVIDANQFKVALASSPGTIVTTTGAATTLSFTQQSAFGAGNVPIQLGDANTGANNVTLLTGGAFEIERGVNVTSNGSGSVTIGGNTDNNSKYLGAVSLGKDVNITQVATTGSNAVTFSGVISSSGAFGLTKVGSGKVVLSANNTYTGTTTVSNGTLLVNGNHAGGGAYVVDAGATLGGTGNVGGGTVTNNGTIAPGASVGTLTTGGAVTMGANSHLAIELSGATADKLVVGGFLNLSAVDFLDVTGVGTETSWIIASYASLTGTFNNITSGYSVNYGTGTNSNITLNLGVAGDYNGDGKVNAADYVVWRKNPGGFPTNSYDIWRQNFGNPPGSGSGLEGGAVPEPAAAGLILSIVLAAFGRRRAR